jgi:uncharacterized membrane protein (DUF485 family)
MPIGDPSHRRQAEPPKSLLPAAKAPASSSPMPPPPSPQDRVHSEEFLHTLMRRQLKLSVACAAAFLVVLLGLPLANYFAPQLMATRIAGFTLSWLLLGVLFFPAVWGISWFFIRRSIWLEKDEVASVEAGRKEAGQ